ncbi:ABC transporter, partial [Pseudomonas syringae pv. aptata]
MSGTTIRLKGCRKAFADGTVAVKDLHLTIEPGETLAILGPSGCGKTTTLRLIAGLERPDVGQVLFDDQDVTRLPIERRDVGMVFQNYALFPNLDVAGNIVYGLKIRGLSAAERNKRCDELLELV